ncbi:MAG: hypothetical protein ACLSDT_10850, partial [Blautia sp.]
ANTSTNRSVFVVFFAMLYLLLAAFYGKDAKNHIFYHNITNSKTGQGITAKKEFLPFQAKIPFS